MTQKQHKNNIKRHNTTKTTQIKIKQNTTQYNTIRYNTTQQTNHIISHHKTTYNIQHTTTQNS